MSSNKHRKHKEDSTDSDSSITSEENKSKRTSKHSRSRKSPERSSKRNSDDHYKSRRSRSTSRPRENRSHRNNRDRQDNRNRYERERDRHRERSRSNDRNRRERDHDRRRNRRSRSFDHSNAKWGKPDEDNKKKSTNEKREKPNFTLSGKLAEETNTFRGVVINYSEPPEAKKPRRRWRLYPFKGEKALQTLYIHRQSAYLIGRDRKIADLPVDHPSCSKQHAVLQYRLVPFTRDDGSTGKRVRPYIIDMESANGTFINNKKIEPKKYVELLERDVIKFGYSSREYVLLHENSKDEALDDDVKQEEEETEVKKEP